MMKWAAVVVLGGCLQGSVVPCADGRLCPSDTQCDDQHGQCIVEAQRTECDGAAQLDPCTLPGGGAGICREGVCLQPYCGDGVVTGAEECDGDLAGSDADCGSHGYYTQGAGLVTCTDCKFDLSGCDAAKAGRCGDGIVNGPELCDGAPVPGSSCLDLGYDAGRLDCTRSCTPDLSTCRTIGLSALGSPSASFHGMSAHAADDVWAASWDGVYHWNGATWSLASPAGRFDQIWTRADGDVFAITDDAQVWHGHAGAWTSISLPVTSASSIAGDADGHVYALGLGQLFVGDGDSFGVGVPLGFASTGSVWATGPGDVWITGPGTPSLAHWDGTTVTKVVVPTSQNLEAVWGASDDDLYAVGNDGAVIHRDAGGWHAIHLGTHANLLAVSGDGGGATMIVGDGVAFRGEGGSWISIHGATASFYGVAVGGPGEAFLAATRVYRYQGSTWVDLTPPAPDNLLAVGGSAPFAVGESGLALRWDGTFWDTTDTGTTDDLLAVSGDFAVGTHGTVLHWNGAGWDVQHVGTDDLAGVWSASPNDVWAVARDQTIYHYDGTSWSAAGQTTQRPLAIWGAGPNDIWIGELPGAMHWNGAAWTETADPVVAGSDVYAIWGAAANDVYLACALRIMHWNGSAWSTVLDDGAYHSAIWGAAANDVYVVTDGEIVHWDGVSWSQRQPLAFDAPSVVALGGDAASPFALGGGLAIHAAAAGWFDITHVPPQADRLWASADRTLWVATAANLARYDGLVWSWDPAMFSPSATEVGGVWGASASHVIVGQRPGSLLWNGGAMSAGAAPFAYHYDGTSAADAWAQNVDAISHTSGGAWTQSLAATADQQFDGVAAATPSRAWTVGRDGTGGAVWGWNGSGWTEQATPPDELLAAWGDAGAAFACGFGGEIVAGDGTTWTAEDSGTTSPLRALAGGAAGDVFAAGDNGTLLHYDGVRWAPVRFSDGSIEAARAAGEELFLGGVVDGQAPAVWELHRDRPW